MSETAWSAPVERASRYRWGALLAVGFTVLAWASAFVGIRAVGAHDEPGPLTLGRLLVGSLALGAGLLVARRWVWPARREWALVVLCALAWFTVYNLALNVRGDASGGVTGADRAQLRTTVHMSCGVHGGSLACTAGLAARSRAGYLSFAKNSPTSAASRSASTMATM